MNLFYVRAGLLVTLFAVNATAQAVPVTSGQFGANWPLTIQYGELTCQKFGGDSAVVLKTPQGSYAINGIASAREKTHGWKNVRTIWRDNPDIPGTKVPISSLISRGLELCQ